jgi:hypothetical protein
MSSEFSKKDTEKTSRGHKSQRNFRLLGLASVLFCSVIQMLLELAQMTQLLGGMNKPQRE